MFNRIGTIYPLGLNEGLSSGSALALKFDMKYSKKAEGHIGQNVVIIIMKRKPIV